VPHRRRPIKWWPPFVRSHCLGYPRQDQQQTEWCWAGVSAAVAAFYDAATTWTQCAIANAELGFTDCCGAGGSGACNVPWYLDRALTRVGHLVAMTIGTANFATVKGEINAGRPICCRIAWSGGGGHFVALTCWFSFARRRKPVLQWVRVSDPWSAYGTSVWRFSAFATAYQGTGSWTHTYTTS